MGVDVGEDVGVGDKDGNKVCEGVGIDGTNPVDFSVGDAFGGEAELQELLIPAQKRATAKEANT
jgi:hypothetical protein